MGDGGVQENRQATRTGHYLDGRIKSFILELTAPRAGERLLDIGCGSGNHLSLFRKKGCDVTGLDPSPAMIDQAKERLEHRAELRQGRAEDLPFSDNEFDIVTLIHALEFIDDPDRAVAEAIRVCRGRVFIGVMNRCSLLGLQGHLGSPFETWNPSPHRYLPLTRLTAMIRSQLQGVRIQWGSVLFLPWGGYPHGAALEERIPAMKNPFGAFLGLSFSVTFSFQTIQQILREPVGLNREGRHPVPGVVSEWKNGT